MIESLHAITLGLTGIDTRAINPLLCEIKIPYSYGRRSPAAAKQERIFGNSNVRRQDRSTRLWGQGQPSHRPLVRRSPLELRFQYDKRIRSPLFSNGPRDPRQSRCTLTEPYLVVGDPQQDRVPSMTVMDAGCDIWDPWT